MQHQRYNEHKTVLHEVLPLELPLQCIFLIATPCNFRCKYCIQSNKHSSPALSTLIKAGYDFMSLESFKNYTDNIAEYVASLSSGIKIKVVTISGFGETMMNPHLPDMISYVKQANIAEKIQIYTNGSLLTNEYSNKLIEAGLDIIKISLQGIDAEQYENTCGVALNYDNFLNELRYFYKRKRNCHVVVKIADIALKDDGDKQRYYDIFRVGEICDEANIEYIYSTNGFDYTPNQTHIGITTGKVVGGDTCNNIFRLVEIQTDGKLYACARYDKNGFLIPSIGDLNIQRFGEIWNKGEHYKLLQYVLKHHRCRGNDDCYYFRSLSSDVDIIDGYEQEILKRLEEKYK